MSVHRYRSEDLAAFPPAWGQIVRQPTGAATFHSDQLSYWDAIASLRFDGETGIGWFEVRKRPLAGAEVERHRLTPEALLCIEGEAACVVGAPEEPGATRPGGFRAFHVSQGEGLVFLPGAWHAIPFPLTERAVFWVVFRTGTAQTDLEVLNLEQSRGFSFEVA